MQGVAVRTVVNPDDSFAPRQVWNCRAPIDYSNILQSVLFGRRYNDPGWLFANADLPLSQVQTALEIYLGR